MNCWGEWPRLASRMVWTSFKTVVASADFSEVRGRQADFSLSGQNGPEDLFP